MNKSSEMVRTVDKRRILGKVQTKGFQSFSPCIDFKIYFTYSQIVISNNINL